jgi:hypothetical protein
MIFSRTDSVQIEQDNFCPPMCEPGCDGAANPTCGAGDADACRPNRRLSTLPQKQRLVPLPNIAVEESAENRAVVSLSLPHADRPRSLRIECESTRFRAAHDAVLREIRVAPRRPSTQVCCLAWRQSQILLLQLRHLPDLVDFQARILSLPTIERLFADPGLPDHLRHRNTYL